MIRSIVHLDQMKQPIWTGLLLILLENRFVLEVLADTTPCTARPTLCSFCQDSVAELTGAGPVLSCSDAAPLDQLVGEQISNAIDACHEIRAYFTSSTADRLLRGEDNERDRMLRGNGFALSSSVCVEQGCCGDKKTAGTPKISACKC